jgi:DNA-binding response OmpR family regulator
MGADEVIRVLVADGDASLRQQLHAALAGDSIAVDCVSDLAAALASLAEYQYAVIVLDIGLPGGDIGQAVSAIASQNRRPVVLVLGSPEAARALDVEIVQIVLRRPVRLQQVVDIIRSCARNSAVRNPSVAPPTKNDQLTS